MTKEILFPDSKIENIIESIELPELIKTKDIYLDLLEVIISQQLSGRVAKIIFNRFLGLFEDNYPAPEVLLKTDNRKLREVGLSNSKSNYVKNLAQFALVNNISVKYIDSLTDDEIIELLTRIKGVGKWSVEMILMFSLLRPDVFPHDDLVIKKSMVELYDIKQNGIELIEKMKSIAEKWRPNRSLASRYLWVYYGLKMAKKKV